MKCPMDGQEMVKTSVVGIDNSWRCGSCGGCLIEGWAINKLAEGGVLKIQNSDKVVELQSNKEPMCPEDGEKMINSQGEELPAGIQMWKCEKCKRWWLPGNSVFDLAGAFTVKKEYLKTWKKKNDLTTFALPVVLTIMLALGLGMILRQVRLRQMWQIQAAVVRSTNVRYLGEGKAEIKMMVNGDLGIVEFRPEGQQDWQQAAVMTQGDWQVAEIAGVTPGQKFLLKWNGGIVQLTVGEQQ